MAFLSSMNIIGSGLTAQQLRLDVISENITNINTTRVERTQNAANENADAAEGENATEETERTGPYRRKIVVLESESNKNGFRLAMDRAARNVSVRTRNPAWQSYIDRHISNRGYETAGGVHLAEIREDETDFPFVYDPTHPDANEAGYVELPNITLVKEVTDAMAASQAFNANVTAFNTLKQVISKAMEIGR